MEIKREQAKQKKQSDGQRQTDRQRQRQTDRIRKYEPDGRDKKATRGERQNVDKMDRGKKGTGYGWTDERAREDS